MRIYEHSTPFPLKKKLKIVVQFSPCNSQVSVNHQVLTLLDTFQPHLCCCEDFYTL